MLSALGNALAARLSVAAARRKLIATVCCKALFSSGSPSRAQNVGQNSRNQEPNGHDASHQGRAYVYALDSGR